MFTANPFNPLGISIILPDTFFGWMTYCQVVAHILLHSQHHLAEVDEYNNIHLCTSNIYSYGLSAVNVNVGNCCLTCHAT